MKTVVFVEDVHQEIPSMYAVYQEHGGRNVGISGCITVILAHRCCVGSIKVLTEQKGSWIRALLLLNSIKQCTVQDSSKLDQLVLAKLNPSTEIFFEVLSFCKDMKSPFASKIVFNLH